MFLGKHRRKFARKLEVIPVAVITLLQLVSVMQNFQRTGILIYEAVFLALFGFGDAYKDGAVEKFVDGFGGIPRAPCRGAEH